MTTLQDKIFSGAPLDEISGFLDALDPPARRAACELPRDAQRALYELAGSAEPLTVTDLVPASVPDLTPVWQAGFNTLPLPRFGRRFAKPMTRSGGQVFGYNEGVFRWLIGPGWFVLRPTEGDEGRHGGVVVDYYLQPSGPRPEAWPWLVPNWVGPQVLVYHHTRDFLRRVSRHVVVGSAYKAGTRPLDAWFTLCREDP